MPGSPRGLAEGKRHELRPLIGMNDSPGFGLRRAIGHPQRVDDQLGSYMAAIDQPTIPSRKGSWTAAR